MLREKDRVCSQPKLYSETLPQQKNATNNSCKQIENCQVTGLTFKALIGDLSSISQLRVSKHSLLFLLKEKGCPMRNQRHWDIKWLMYYSSRTGITLGFLSAGWFPENYTLHWSKLTWATPRLLNTSEKWVDHCPLFSVHSPTNLVETDSSE